MRLEPKNDTKPKHWKSPNVELELGENKRATDELRKMRKKRLNETSSEKW